MLSGENPLHSVLLMLANGLASIPGRGGSQSASRRADRRKVRVQLQMGPRLGYGIIG
jgi:hypothetical protein